ncbi:DNA excision repair protein ERCC-1-like isoform X1 [Mizuhopecten yessoensis]|uniref:DNA excision repair protein ERCC-1-like isoform X1 n=1 Tax=Mizuhopecten yessoensis TaxID=6573 RepID=UPI000B45B578|nr:DNA excision repair protein ERCC-1-like isoform X1 [Mizuhopecten yessoensis]
MAAEKKKFKIPSSVEMDQSSTVLKPQDTLAAFKRQKIEDESRKTADKKKTAPDPNQIKIGSFLTSSKPSATTSNTTTSEPSRQGSAVTVKKDASSSAAVSEMVNKGVISTKPTDIMVAPITVGKGSTSNALIVNPRQRGNPILKSVRNVAWEFGDIVPDYVMGLSTCALYLSLRYHQLNPNYIHDRLKQLGRAYDLRIMLVQVDIKEPHHYLKELAKICILADCTLMLAFTTEEAGRYLETYKVYEFKPPDAIMEKTDHDFVSKFTDCLTSVKSVNKTDAVTLMSTFKTLEGVMEASKEDLSLCPGFGPQKAKRLYDVFQEPFVKAKKQNPENR